MKKIPPIKWGLAFSAVGHAICGTGGISAVAGADSTLVHVTVFTGFFMGVVGNFLTTLFTNGNGSTPPPTQPTNENKTP